MIFYLPPWFTITLELVTLNFISSVNSRNVFQLRDGAEDAGVVNYSEHLSCVVMAPGSSLEWVDPGWTPGTHKRVQAPLSHSLQLERGEKTEQRVHELRQGQGEITH